MSKCFACRYFKQTAPLDFMVSGSCTWTSPVSLPKWLENFVTSGDHYYGPRREVGTGAHTVWNCAAMEQVDESVIAKRRSEAWYE